jgi:hypothetical protein
VNWARKVLRVDVRLRAAWRAIQFIAASMARHDYMRFGAIPHA